MDYCEKWGKNIEEAVRLALIDMKLQRDQVEVIVLEEPSRGFLGLGAKLAKVRVVKKAEEEKKPEKPEKRSVSEDHDYKEKKPQKEKAEEKDSEPAEDGEGEIPVVVPVKIKKPKGKSSQKKPPRKMEKGRTSELREQDSSNNEKEEAASFEPYEADLKIFSKFAVTSEDAGAIQANDSSGAEFLREICAKMNLSVEVQAYELDDVLYLNVIGKDTGTIIGKRGQTMDALQYLTGLVVNKDREKYMRVIINAENYREKREKTLQQLAYRLSEKVVKTGKNVRLEPMNPYERKVIHSTLQGNSKVTTRSEGEEPYRRIVIELKR